MHARSHFISYCALGALVLFLVYVRLHIHITMPPKKAKVARPPAVTYKFETEKMQQYVDAAREANPLAGKILDMTLELASTHHSIEKAVFAAYENDEKLQKHGQDLQDHFPGSTVQSFLSSTTWPTGLHLVQLWMLGVRPNDGYSLPTDQDILCVMSLMLVHGVQTDPAIPGVDALSTRHIDITRKVFLNKPDGVHADDAVPIASVGFVKGKKRALAMLMLAKSVIAAGIDLRSAWPSLWYHHSPYPTELNEEVGGRT